VNIEPSVEGLDNSDKEYMLEQLMKQDLTQEGKEKLIKEVIEEKHNKYINAGYYDSKGEKYYRKMLNYYHRIISYIKQGGFNSEEINQLKQIERTEQIEYLDSIEENEYFKKIKKSILEHYTGLQKRMQFIHEEIMDKLRLGIESCEKALSEGNLSDDKKKEAQGLLEIYREDLQNEKYDPRIMKDEQSIVFGYPYIKELLPLLEKTNNADEIYNTLFEFFSNKNKEEEKEPKEDYLKWQLEVATFFNPITHNEGNKEYIEKA
jgi:hypothetical protein